MPRRPTRDSARPGKAVGRRLRPLYWTAFIHGLALWYSVEKLFMRSVGFTPLTIAVATACYIVVMTAANIPLGVLADRWSRKGVLYLATACLAAASLICGLADGFAMYVAGISVWGLFYACYAGTYDSVIYDVILEETGQAEGFGRLYGRVQMYDSAAFITGAVVSAGLVHLVPLRAAYLLTVPLTCCGFVTLRRFREPVLHRAGKRARVTDHLGQVLRAAVRSRRTALIGGCLVCSGLAMRLVFEFCQLWWLGLRLPAGWYGPAFAALYAGALAGGWLAGRLAGRRAVLGTAALVLAASACMTAAVPAVVIGAQVAAVTGIIAVQVVVSGYLHDAMPSAIRAGASSVVATVSYAAFVPVALGFGLASRYLGVARASWLAVAAVAGMCVTLAAVTRPQRARPAVRHPGRRGCRGGSDRAGPRRGRGLQARRGAERRHRAGGRPGAGSDP